MSQPKLMDKEGALQHVLKNEKSKTGKLVSLPALGPLHVIREP